jgi:hypothetical protein
MDNTSVGFENRNALTRILRAMPLEDVEIMLCPSDAFTILF